MKRFLSSFRSSALELRDLRCVLVTGLLIALSMIIEAHTIIIGFAKINFAYLATAAIGMLYGPVVSAFAGGICDIVGFLAKPDGGFLPLYTLFGVGQGLIYGMIAYHKLPLAQGKRYDISMAIRLSIARVLDVVIINLLCNTAANLYYAFIPDEAYTAAVTARVIKNVVLLPVDILLISVVLIAVLKAYHIVFGKQQRLA